MRRTSIDAYNKIKENGLLSRRRLEVYEVLFYNGPLTSGEAFQLLNKLSPIRNLTQSRARFTELCQMGVIYEVRTRVCRVTGMNVIEWDVTDRLPIKLEKPKRVKCKHCSGKGYFETTQTRLF